MHGFFDLVVSYALVSNKTSARFYERSAVFKQGIEARHSTGAAYVELFAQTSLPCVLSPQIEYFDIFKSELLCGLFQKYALFVHALNQSELYVGAAYFERNGGKTAAGTHFRGVGSETEIFLAGETVPDVLYKELISFCYACEIYLFIVFCYKPEELFKLFLCPFAGQKNVFKLQNISEELITLFKNL